VTIIHSPNGFGKTAILKLLNELFTQGTNVLRTTPFDELHIYFEDQTHFWVGKKVGASNIGVFNVSGNTLEEIVLPQIVFYYSDSEGETVSSLELKDIGSPVENLQVELQSQQLLLQEARQRGDSRAIVTYETRMRLIEEYLRKEVHLAQQISFLDFLEDNERSVRQTKISLYGKEQNWFQEIRESIPVRFIETQRLLNSTAEARNQSSARRPTMSLAVTLYSEELAKTIIAKLADSTARSQELDRTFPSRLVDLAARHSDIAESELREKLAELEAKRKSLMAVGLVDQNASDAVLAANRIDANTKAVLSLYIEDTRQKLAIFDDIAPKIELLTRIINKRFLYKKTSISRKDGFVFTSPNGTRLALEKLSSGEQHELVLFYELLFKASPGSLIMIDEPEISLHVVWQEQFLQDVQDITRLADVDVLIATHSPDIIDGHRDLVVELEGPEDGGL
jgi:predicted ATP-binding protein involved in virulence